MILTPTFFNLFRKKGFIITLTILSNIETSSIEESKFFSLLPKYNSYFNDFYRCKKDLIHYGLIGYDLDEEFNKVIFITDKGKKIMEKIQECEVLLTAKIRDNGSE